MVLLPRKSVYTIVKPKIKREFIILLTYLNNYPHVELPYFYEWNHTIFRSPTFSYIRNRFKGRFKKLEKTRLKISKIRLFRKRRVVLYKRALGIPRHLFGRKYKRMIKMAHLVVEIRKDVVANDIQITVFNAFKTTTSFFLDTFKLIRKTRKKHPIFSVYVMHMRTPFLFAKIRHYHFFEATWYPFKILHLRVFKKFNMLVVQHLMTYFREFIKSLRIRFRAHAPSLLFGNKFFFAPIFYKYLLQYDPALNLNIDKNGFVMNRYLIQGSKHLFFRHRGRRLRKFYTKKRTKKKIRRKFSFGFKRKELKKLKHKYTKEIALFNKRRFKKYKQQHKRNVAMKNKKSMIYNNIIKRQYSTGPFIGYQKQPYLNKVDEIRKIQIMIEALNISLSTLLESDTQNVSKEHYMLQNPLYPPMEQMQPLHLMYGNNINPPLAHNMSQIPKESVIPLQKTPLNNFVNNTIVTQPKENLVINKDISQYLAIKNIVKNRYHLMGDIEEHLFMSLQYLIYEISGLRPRANWAQKKTFEAPKELLVYCFDNNNLVNKEINSVCIKLLGHFIKKNKQKLALVINTILKNKDKLTLSKHFEHLVQWLNNKKNKKLHFSLESKTELNTQNKTIRTISEKFSFALSITLKEFLDLLILVALDLSVPAELMQNTAFMLEYLQQENYSAIFSVKDKSPEKMNENISNPVQ